MNNLTIMARKGLRTQVVSWLVVLVGMMSLQAQAMTPGDVLQKVAEVKYLIQELRTLEGVEARPRVPAPQVARSPVHVYAKGLELMDKMARYQAEHGLTPVAVPAIPSHKISPADSFDLMVKVAAELSGILKARGVEVTLPERKQYMVAATPSDVFEDTWEASYMMDDIIEPVSEAEVLRNTRTIMNELQDIASARQMQLDVTSTKGEGKQSYDCNIEAYRTMYLLSDLRRQLDMGNTFVGPFPSGSVTTSEVYSSTRLMLAELAAVKHHLNIESTTRVAPAVEGEISSDDVFGELKTIQNAVQLLL